MNKAQGASNLLSEFFHKTLTVKQKQSIVFLVGALV